MPAKDLPTEVLLQVFQHSTRQDLYTYLFVSQAWHSLVAQVYFEELDLKALNVFRLKPILFNFNEKNDTEKKQLNYFRYCHYTKKLNILKDSEEHLQSELSQAEIAQSHVQVKKEEQGKGLVVLGDESIFTDQELKTFLSFLPTLEYIDLSNSEYVTIYMRYLSQMDNTQHCLQHIKEISNNGIEFPRRCNHLHFEACYIFCATITQIYKPISYP